MQSTHDLNHVRVYSLKFNSPFLLAKVIPSDDLIPIERNRKKNLLNTFKFKNIVNDIVLKVKPTKEEILNRLVIEKKVLLNDFFYHIR